MIASFAAAKDRVLAPNLQMRGERQRCFHWLNFRLSLLTGADNPFETGAVSEREANWKTSGAFRKHGPLSARR